MYSEQAVNQELRSLGYLAKKTQTGQWWIALPKAELRLNLQVAWLDGMSDQVTFQKPKLKGR